METVVVSDAVHARACIALRVLLPEVEMTSQCRGVIVIEICQPRFAGSVSEPSDFTIDHSWSRLDLGRCILSGDDARSQNPLWTARIPLPVAEG